VLAGGVPHQGVLGAAECKLIHKGYLRPAKGSPIFHSPTYFTGIRNEVFPPLGHRGVSRYIKGVNGPNSAETSAPAFC
jgi:hypothetical protein